MIIDNSVKVSNYKCFGDTPQGFEKIMPINIIIGKNNSGKSSLIDIVWYLTNRESPLLKNNNSNVRPIVTISNIIFSQEDFTKAVAFSNARYASDRKYTVTPVNRSYVASFIGSKYGIELDGTNIEKTFWWDGFDEASAGGLKFSIPEKAIIPFSSLKILGVSAERDIISEKPYHELKLDEKGNGATNIIQQVYTKSNYDTKLITKELLRELNSIINPDIKFTNIIPQEHDSGSWEIYFEDENNNLVALSKMGSGIKTILLVLLNTIVKPKLENKKEDKYVFAFEELENNLHPSLLRRLFNYIAEYSQKNQAYFFITTHSSIVIDLFSNNENAQILHTQNIGGETVVATVLSMSDNRNVLKDLDVRASDLLMSNGVIWVEGPSDRIYINKWISLIAPELKEGMHYSIMFYGGRLLSNLSFHEEWLEKEFIPLLKINHNAFVVIDRDAKDISSELNATKQRIQSEIGEDNCWITEGREIENYLSADLLKRWLKEAHNKDVLVTTEQYVKIEVELKKKKIEIDYNKDKKGYSIEIVEHIQDQDLGVFDLKNKLYQLVARIKEWNSLT